MIKQIAAIGLALGMMGGANAALFSRAGGTMVYDDVLNITWLADWNYAKTSGYAAANAGGSGTTEILSSGEMAWDAAKSWAAGLVFGGYSDWRLPSSLNYENGGGPCLGGGCNSSEMGYMFYMNWKVFGGYDISTALNPANLALFENVQTSNYWSGTETSNNERPPTFWAWSFNTGGGVQNKTEFKTFARFAVAVRDGDVAPVPVPVPATLALLGLGLAGIGAVRRRASR
jgi:hypothetical protein